MFFVCVTVIYSGCAGGSVKSTANLQGSYGPLEQDDEVIGQIDEVFKKTPAMRRFGQFTIPNLRAIARKTHLEPVAVSRCDLEVLRIFIASDWIPILVGKSS